MGLENCSRNSGPFCFTQRVRAVNNARYTHHMLRLFSKTTLLALACLLGGAGGLCAQKMVPDAPVKKFKLPMFGEDGYKIWDLQGEEGLYISQDELEVDKMVLRLFAAGDPVVPQTIIESPKATIYPQNSEATGKQAIYITERGNAFAIFGRDWTWNGREQTIIIRSDARVTFREALGSIIE